MRRTNRRLASLGSLLLTILTVMILVSAGCYARMAKVVSGSGMPKTEARQPGAFDRVRSEGAADVIVTVGAAAAGTDDVEAAPPAGTMTTVTVSADDNIVPLIETEVRGGELVISSRTPYRPKSPVKVTVTTPLLEELRLNGSGQALITGARGARLETAIHGSGDVRIEKLDVDRLDVQIAGSGSVTGDGSADHVHVSVNGSGNVELADVTAQTADVTISGSGDATLNVAATLNAHVAGSGDVRYRGTPKVESTVAGSGKVGPAE
jgi:carbon monoxide dehydrogenase subunit G